MKDLVKNFDAFSVWRIIGKTELKKTKQSGNRC